MSQIRGTTPPQNKPVDNQQAGETKARQDVKTEDIKDFSNAVGAGKKGKKGQKNDLVDKSVVTEQSGKDIKLSEKKADSPEDLFRGFKKEKSARDNGEEKESMDESKSPVLITGSGSTQPVPVATDARVQEIALQKADSELLQRVEQVADKIMVQTAKDVKEVNIKFNDRLLPGTEVSVKMEQRGIKLEFATTSPDSLNFINKGEMALTDALNKRFGADVTINVNFEGNSQDQDQSGDGRSRNQYVPDDPSEQNE